MNAGGAGGIAGRWWLSIACVIAVALALRLAYLHQVAALPFFDQPVGDSAVYLERAGEIVSGRLVAERPFFYGSVFYPYYLAAVLSLTHGLYWVCLVQSLAGCLLVGLLAVVTRRLFGTRAGIAAGIVAALYGPIAFFEADVRGVIWALLAMSIALLACEAWARRPDGRWRSILPWLCGAGVGLAAVERPNLIVLVPLVAAWWAMHGRQGRTRSVTALLVAAALPLTLVAALNFAGSGSWSPLTTSGGINLSIGFHAGASGTYEEPWQGADAHFSARHTDLEKASVLMASGEAGRPLTPQEASNHWARKAATHIASHPAEAAALILRKALLLLNDGEVPNHLDYAFIRERAPALRLMPVGFGVVLVLATLGVGFSLLGGRRRSETLLLLVVAGGAMASVLPFFVADRYRAPMLPPLIVAAGAGVAGILDLFKSRARSHEPRLLLVFLCGLAAAVIATLPLVRPMMGRDYWMLAQAHQARGELRAAATAYEAAVREEGDDGELLNNLALVYRSLGDRERAIATLGKAVTADPGLAFPHKNLGMLLIAQGAHDSALVELRSAAALDTSDAEVQGAIGALLAERGDRSGAEVAFDKANALAPGDARLAALIAHYRAPSGGTP